MKIKYMWQGVERDGEVTSHGVTQGKPYYAVNGNIVFEEQVISEVAPERPLPAVSEMIEASVDKVLNNVIELAVNKAVQEMIEVLDRREECRKKSSLKEILKNFVVSTIKKCLGRLKRLKLIKIKRKNSKTE